MVPKPTRVLPKQRELPVRLRALLKAARQLREIQTDWTGPDQNLHKALMFNRRLWCIFFADAESNESPNSLEVSSRDRQYCHFRFCTNLRNAERSRIHRS